MINSQTENLEIDSDIIELISDAVKSLPKQMAEIFFQKYFEGKQLKEIAKDVVVIQPFISRSVLREKLLQSINITFLL